MIKEKEYALLEEYIYSALTIEAQDVLYTALQRFLVNQL